MKSEPKWKLDEDWGVGIDPMNWKIYHRTRDKSGKRANWKAAGYYPTLEMLIEGMQRKMVLTDSDQPDILTHVNHAIDAWQNAVATLRYQIEALGSDVADMPPAVAYRRLAA